MKKVALFTFFWLTVLPILCQNSGEQIKRELRLKQNTSTPQTNNSTRNRSSSINGFGTYNSKNVRNQIISVEGVKFLMVGVGGGV